MKNIVCCFPIEIKVRALDARLYLAMKFLNQGYPCLIGQQDGVNEEMFKLETPFIYFAKGTVAASGVKMYSKIKKRGGVVLHLDEEGGLSMNNPKFLLNRYHDSFLPYVDMLYLWGEEHKSILLKHKKALKEEKVVVTGHPRFDMRKPHFIPYYKKIRSKRAIWRQKYILFNINLGLANGNWAYKYMHNHAKKIALREGSIFDSEQFEYLYKEEKKDLLGFINVIHNLVKKYPSLQVVVRAHPAESPEIYHKEFDKYKNVIISREGSVQEWIIDSLAIIHRDCTTAIEGFFLEKPIISYQPNEISEIVSANMIHHLPIKVSQVIKTEEALLSKIEEVVSDTYPKVDKAEREKQEKEVKAVYANIDFESADKIVEETEKFLTENPFNFKGTGNILKELAKPKSLFYYKRTLIGIIQNMIYGKNSQARYEKTKFDFLKKEELESRIEALKTVMDIPSYQVNKVFDNTFYISQ